MFQVRYREAPLRTIWMARRPRVGESSVAMFTLWYAGSRVLTDFRRTDPRRLLGLTGSQLTALVLIAIVLVGLAFRHQRDAGRPEATKQRDRVGSALADLGAIRSSKWQTDPGASVSTR